MSRRLTALAWIALALAITPVAGAHTASTGFLSLSVEGSRASGAIELAVRDAELAVGLDEDRDGRVTWHEVRARETALDAYVLARLRIGDARGSCPLHVGRLAINERVDGNYLWIPLEVTCGARLQHLRVGYDLLSEVDPSHRALLTVSALGTTQTAIAGGPLGERLLALDHPSHWRAFTEYLRAGVWHILSGIDHLLFLVSLLLPAVLVRREGRWQAVSMPGPALTNILKVVTAFTLAHSVTLSLAALDVVRLPSRLTESMIAASIIIAAANNLRPRVTDGCWRIAFGFGLLHGFGFASVLTDMGLPAGARLVSLVGFNAGVELGQLAVVAAVMPLAYAARATRFYQDHFLRWGSSAIATLASFWLIQRALLT